MVEVEVFGARTRTGAAGANPAVRPGSHDRLAVSTAEMRRLCILAAGSAGVSEGHMAIEFVDAGRIAELNAKYRGVRSPTDVLAFPMDAVESGAAGEGVAEEGPPGGGESSPPERSMIGQRELGDVVICPEHTVDLREAIIHGVLHLVGMDHETDGGEMLARQHELLARASR
jgi:probable rRNA maturation factor